MRARCPRARTPDAVLAYTDPLLLAQAEINELDCGHFDVYVGSWFEKATSAYLKFLEQHVPVQAKI